MTPLEQYLNNATRGIWGKHKLEIREELHNDILERTRKHQLAGLSFDAAITQAIQELGDARVLNRGMTGVYMMPTFIKSAVAAVMISLAVILTMQPGIAQVTSTTRLPVPQCLESKSPTVDILVQNNKTLPVSCEFGQLWFSLSSLKKVLQPLDIKVLEFPDAPYRDVYLKFPEGFTAKVHLDWNQIRFSDPSIVLNPDYISAIALTEALSLTPLNVRITGWENPRITVGKTTFTLGTNEARVNAESLYVEALRSSLEYSFPQIKDPEPLLHIPVTLGDHLYAHTIRYNAEPGTIIAVLSREPVSGMYQPMNGEKPPKLMRRITLTPVGQDGTFQYFSRSKTLRFENQIDKLKPLVVDGVSDVIVLRLTGDFSFNSKEQLQIIKPGALSLESIKKL
jgi:hypothetical protein